MQMRSLFYARALARASAASVVTLLSSASHAAVNGTVDFTYNWQDRGGTYHPAKFVTTKYVYNLGFDVKNGQLDSNGNEIVVVTGPPGFQTMDVSVFAKVPGVVEVKFDNLAADPYFVPWSLNIDPTINNPPVNINQPNSSDAAKMIGVTQMIKFANDYYGIAPLNANLPAIKVYYNSTIVGSSMGKSVMNLGYADWGNIDVILHEYGHHVAEYNNLDWRDGLGNGLGLQHSFNQDNISNRAGGRNYGATDGSRLAWQEGIASYLGLTAIKTVPLSAKIPGMVFDDNDRAYDSYSPNAGVGTFDGTDLGFSVQIESRSLTVNNGNTIRNGGSNTTFDARGQGEGDEMSVMRVLNDYMDSENEGYARNADATNFGATAVFNQTKGADTLYDYWRTVGTAARADKTKVGLPGAAPDAQAMARLGATLEEYGVSEIPTFTGSTLSLRPRITWDEQNNGNSGFYKVLIYSSDWTNLVFQSPQLTDPSVPAIQTGIFYDLPSDLNAGTYNYVILNDPALSLQAELNASNFNWYWSGAQTFTVIPEPASLGAFAMIASMALRRRRCA